MAPETDRLEPLAPVPAMVQVWGAPRISGALMRIAPALSSIAIPSAELAGAMVKAEVSSGPPCAMVTLVMPLGVELNCMLPTVKLPSSVVT